MKKATKKTTASRSRTAMRPEYDFAGGTRGQYARKFADGTNLILLAPDVAAEFRTATAVNKALREVLKARIKRRTA
jgi:hypothetical protein